MIDIAKQLKSYKLLVKGDVQGVGYRQFALNIANNYGVKGWVENLIYGDVEILATGNEQQIQSFIDELHQGPHGAKVDSLYIEQIDLQRFESFEIRF